MNIVDDFNDKFYVVMKDVLEPEYCQKAIKYFFELYNSNQLTKDEQCPLSDSVYGDSFFDKLLEELAPFFSEISGKQLIPTYSYARIYRTGETLKFHRDRPACEYSATINLGFSGQNWPIFFNKKDTAEHGTKLCLEPGDAVLYKGCDIYHWREEYKGEWQCQIFLHYVDANGPHKDEKFDKRQILGIKKDQQKTISNDVIYYWQFENVLTHSYCDFLINKYSNMQLERGKIGGHINNTLDLKIRNVNKTPLPLHQDIGAQLIGNAFIANQQAWKFDINTCNQIEYLKYCNEGRYISHLDTSFSNDDMIHRKLTALAFLNDDFDGGKFFLQISEHKLYPLQTKGTVIVFPSFFLHGVEDVIKGQRHTVVCWMLGPKFK